MNKNILLISLFAVVFLASCEETSETQTSPSDTDSSGANNSNVIANGTNCATSTANVIAYLNCFRGLAGMSSLSSDSVLNTASLNHAKYLNANNKSGHGQITGLPSFTGASPNARAAFVGYKSNVSENVSTHTNAGYQNSLEGLMSAIYHRFGFLNTEIDRIGTGKNQTDSSKIKAFVYKMGNNAVNELCKGNAYSGPNAIRFTCLDALGAFDNNHGVDNVLYLSALSNIANSNPAIIKWPAQNSIDVIPAFNQESPDPLPAYSVSGYPVSIAFNPHKFSSAPSVSAFSLTKISTGNAVSVITVMNKDNDPNSTFNAYQHALFPTERLDWASEYRADVNYNDGAEKTLSWTFTTRNLGMTVHTVSGSTPTLNGVVSGETFAVYLPPRDANDSLLAYSSTFTTGMVLDVQFIDSNTLQVTATGNGTVTLNYHGSAISFTI